MKKLNDLTLKLYVIYHGLREEHGQDLIEYTLIGGVVALGAIAGMSTFANYINNAFIAIGTKLSTYAS